MPFPQTDWNDWTPDEYQVDAPATSLHFERWFRNPVAMAQGAPGAPVLWGGWTPWDSNANGDSVGLIYSAAADGNAASVESPDMEDGYEYMMRLRSPQKTSGSVADFNISARLETGTLVTLTALTMAGVSDTGATRLGGCVYSFLPRVTKRTFEFRSDITNSPTNDLIASFLEQRMHRSADTKIKNLRMWLDGQSFTGTTEVYFYRRAARIYD